MNEQLKELMLKAGYAAPELAGRANKLAELLVKQMLDITDAHTEVFQTDRDKALVDHIKKSVQQHFGVELWQ